MSGIFGTVPPPVFRADAPVIRADALVIRADALVIRADALANMNYPLGFCSNLVVGTDMKLQGKVYVSGHRGMVGSAVCRRLADSDCELITADRDQLDLRDLDATTDFYASQRPDVVVFAAARVGGIAANDAYPVEFLSDNLLMSVAAINAAYRTGVRRFLYLGSTCIYPRDCPQPIRESSLLTGPLEATNEAYALAKIGGLKLCQYYRRQYDVMFHSAMPTNLYGPGDNYHPQHSHVLPALLRRFHEAKAGGAARGHDLGYRVTATRIPIRR